MLTAILSSSQLSKRRSLQSTTEKIAEVLFRQGCREVVLTGIFEQNKTVYWQSSAKMGDNHQESVKYDLLDSSVKTIINKAQAIREKAYCPYSKFAVGAALLCEDGTIVDGCNVENVSYGLTICAERAAICKAISQEQKSFKCIAICAEMEDYFVSPCGACRQVLAEFNTGMEVYLCKPNNDIVKTSVTKLLPLSFTPNWVSFST